MKDESVDKVFEFIEVRMSYGEVCEPLGKNMHDRGAYAAKRRVPLLLNEARASPRVGTIMAIAAAKYGHMVMLEERGGTVQVWMRRDLPISEKWILAELLETYCKGLRKLRQLEGEG